MNAAAPSWLDIIGTTADAIAGLGTLGALIIATVVFKHQVEDSRRAQASKVTINLDYIGPDDSERVAANIETDNASDQPIFEVMCVVQLGGDPMLEGLAGHRHAGERFRMNKGDTDSMRLEADEDSFIDTAMMYFTDAAGRRWIRDTNGKLEQVTDGETLWVKLLAKVGIRRDRVFP